MQQLLNKMREDLSQLVAMSADLMRVSQQQTQQIRAMTESIVELRLLSEAQWQRMD